jgi:protocatechuate 3,4-dioxygenase, beta subunit
MQTPFRTNMLKPTVPVDDLHHHDDTRQTRPEPDVACPPTLHTAGASGGLLSSGSSPSEPLVLRTATSDEILGPFHPIHSPLDRGSDLTFIPGREGCALGPILYLSGRVMNRRGEPVANAELDIWQANAAGRYAHPADENPAPIDPNFEGHATIRSGPDGAWSIKTVRPGGYPVTSDWSRPPHIHFDVKGRFSRLVTQMYFEGEPLNEKDILLQRAWSKETLISHYVEASGSTGSSVLHARWDIVLLGG